MAVMSVVENDSSAIGLFSQAARLLLGMLPELVPEKRNVGHEPGVQMLEQLDDGQ